jgi:GTPase
MSIKKERQQIQVRTERAVVAAVRLPDSRFDPQDPFGELKSLAEQAGATVVGELTQTREAPEAGTYMGRGKILELKALCDTLDAGVVIFDHELSPKQIAKIEELTERKIIDRSELILDIFASRASTHEAKLQVELAQLEYTIPRLRAMWDHLERIVGGGGIAGIGTRGPGEMQLEIDRRLAQRKKLALQSQIEEIQQRRRREVQARKRENLTVGIVGYTNAGKSTLFNSLTSGGAYADDRLFATLISRTRPWDLSLRSKPSRSATHGHESGNGFGLAEPAGAGPGGDEVLLSDTVGFVRDLPHNLVASFRATLEEATHADLLLIVLDVSDPASQLQYDTVNTTLESLFHEQAEYAEAEGEAWREPSRLLLLNKVDKLNDNRELLVWKQRVPEAIAISALPPPPGVEPLDRPGHRELVARVRTMLLGAEHEVVMSLPMSQAKAISTIEHRSHVLERDYEGDRVKLLVRIGERVLARLKVSTKGLEVAPIKPSRSRA